MDKIVYVDKRVFCRGCKQHFILTKGEQEFFYKIGYLPPRRCKPCRKNLKRMERRNRRKMAKELAKLENVTVEIKETTIGPIVVSQMTVTTTTMSVLP